MPAAEQLVGPVPWDALPLLVLYVVGVLLPLVEAARLDREIGRW